MEELIRGGREDEAIENNKGIHLFDKKTISVVR